MELHRRPHQWCNSGTSDNEARKTPKPNGIDLPRLGPYVMKRDSSGVNFKDGFTTYMDAISAMETMMKPNPTNVHMYDQNIPARPPFSSPCELELVRGQCLIRGRRSPGGSAQVETSGLAYMRINSQVACKTAEKLNAASGRKFRFENINPKTSCHTKRRQIVP
jgi:hypothetical protein